MVNRIVGDKGNNVLGGSWDNDKIEGLGGDDQLWGGGGDDILIGGTGNDILEGGQGKDTYLFNRGDGQDHILASQFPDSNNIDRLVFGDKIAPADIYLQRLGNDLYIEIRGTSDRIMIDLFFDPAVPQFDGTLARASGVQQIGFADGMLWNRDAIITHMVLDASPLTQLKDGDDNFYSNGNVDGGGGNDFLNAEAFMVYANGGAGDDKIYTYAGPHSVIVGGSGNDDMNGGYADSIYNGGTGNDTVFDKGGSNSFLFSRGWGQDTLTIVTDSYSANQFQMLSFDDVLPGGLRFSRSDGGSGKDLQIELAGSSDSVTITG